MEVALKYFKRWEKLFCNKGFTSNDVLQLVGRFVDFEELAPRIDDMIRLAPWELQYMSHAWIFNIIRIPRICHVLFRWRRWLRKAFKSFHIRQFLSNVIQELLGFISTGSLGFGEVIERTPHEFHIVLVGGYDVVLVELGIEHVALMLLLVQFGQIQVLLGR